MLFRVSVKSYSQKYWWFKVMVNITWWSSGSNSFSSCTVDIGPKCLFMFNGQLEVCGKWTYLKTTEAFSTSRQVSSFLQSSPFYCRRSQSQGQQKENLGCVIMTGGLLSSLGPLCFPESVFPELIHSSAEDLSPEELRRHCRIFLHT